MKILIINQSFWPDVVATAQQAHDLARYLASHGDEVTVVASRSLYGRPRATLAPSETVDGVKVLRVSRNFFSKRGLVTRSIDYFRFNIACLIKALLLPRQDVVICLTTPPFVGLIGVALRLLKRSRFVLWTMDLYPDLPVEAGIIRRGGIGHRLFRALDSISLRWADRVIVLGRCMRDRIVSKGVDPAKVDLVHPWSDPTEIPAHRPDAGGERNHYRDQWGIGDRFVIQYSGNFGLGHDVETVSEAMLRLKDDDGIRWVIVGDGIMKPAIEEFVARNHIGNVLLKPYEPRSQLGALIALGNMHLVLMVPGFEGVILPSKFYGVLAAGRPAVFVGPVASEVGRVIEEERCGFVVPNGDAARLVQVIAEIRANPALGAELGQRGRKALELRYSMQDACGRWRDLLHRLVPDSPEATRDPRDRPNSP